MKSIFFLFVLFCCALKLRSQDVSSQEVVTTKESLDRVNSKGSHNINAYYSYRSFKEQGDNYPVVWRLNTMAFGYLYSLTNNTNIGIYGRFRADHTDELTTGTTIYRYSATATDIVFKCQFFWVNTSYIGLYSGLEFGMQFAQPLSTEIISGNNPRSYIGSYSGGETAGLLTIVGCKFRLKKDTHWYFNAELAAYDGIGFAAGAGYRF